ncbi:DUF3299 domain-containing protein [Wohlfahrtiimonas larvae]|uniref:DUF3299 domain-containing protein n=1 Tax=Wohlfahrtiimonas larvae TaxID=1157986 RepID=UPI00098D39FF|nr:DUF3299 domain-containing protein [Wohlfahrtiimonas larvae]
MIWLVRVVGLLFIGLFLVLGFGIHQNTPQEYQKIQWHDLISQDPITPETLFVNMNLNAISDSDPMAQEMLQDILAEWANAPINELLNDHAVNISGYIVPLDWAEDRSLNEFLLVPYFGACIHSPPPPANQIIYVKMDEPLKGARSMEEISISGKLVIQRNDAAAMGVSGYTILPDEIKRYE